MKEPDLTDLITRSQKGDVSAFGRLYQIFRESVFNVVYQMLGSVEDADDIAQETFVRAWERLRQLTSPYAFRNWLLSIAVNLARNSLRRRPPEMITDAEDGTDEILEHTGLNAKNQADASLEAEVRDVRRQVRRAVARLPPAFREVVVLHYFEDLDITDVAQILKIPPGTVKSRLARARRLLMRDLRMIL